MFVNSCNSSFYKKTNRKNNYKKDGNVLESIISRKPVDTKFNDIESSTTS